MISKHFKGPILYGVSNKCCLDGALDGAQDGALDSALDGARINEILTFV